MIPGLVRNTCRHRVLALGEVPYDARGVAGGVGALRCRHFPRTTNNVPLETNQFAMCRPAPFAPARRGYARVPNRHAGVRNLSCDTDRPADWRSARAWRRGDTTALRCGNETLVLWELPVFSHSVFFLRRPIPALLLLSSQIASTSSVSANGPKADVSTLTRELSRPRDTHAPPRFVLLSPCTHARRAFRVFPPPWVAIKNNQQAPAWELIASARPMPTVSAPRAPLSELTADAFLDDLVRLSLIYGTPGLGGTRTGSGNTTRSPAADPIFQRHGQTVGGSFLRVFKNHQA